MEESPHDSGQPPEKQKRAARPSVNVWLPILILLILVALFAFNRRDSVSRITYSFFREQLEKDNIDYVKFGQREVTGRFREEPEAPKKLNKKRGMGSPEGPER